MSSFLVIDFGERRTGVAVGESETGIVTPVSTIHRSSDLQLIDELERLTSQHGASQLVLGLPCRLDGSEGDAALRVRSFAKKVSARLPLPIDFVSETLTSRAARERIRSYAPPTANSRSRKASHSKRNKAKIRSPHHQIDAVAAQIIGEQFLHRVLTP